jgi:hypothetical protein
VQVKNDQPPTVQIDQSVGELNQFFQMQVFRPHSNPSQNESMDSHYDISLPTDNWPLMLNAFAPVICAAQARLARWLLSRLAVLE